MNETSTEGNTMSIKEETQSWIEKRYGPVTIKHEVLASVPVFKGTAYGRGETEEEATAALYADLTSGLEQGVTHERN